MKERTRLIPATGQQLVAIGQLGMNERDARLRRGVAQLALGRCARREIFGIRLLGHHSSLLLLSDWVAENRICVINFDQGSVSTQVGDRAIANRLHDRIGGEISND